MVATKARTAGRKAKSRAKDPMLQRRLFTVDEYIRIGEAGIIGPEERTELLEGEILTMAPIGNPHAVTLRKVTRWCYSNLPSSDVIILVQDPIHVPPYGMPQPDLAVVRFHADQYLSGHPGPEDILLLVEISDTTLGYDRGRKLDSYATAGIPDYWIFALTLKRIIVNRKPVDGRYTEVFEVGLGGTVSPTAFSNLVLSADEIFG